MRLAVYSTMDGLDWGASEELWSQAAARLLDRGHAVSVSYHHCEPLPEPLRALRRRGLDVHVRPPAPTTPRALARAVARRVRQPRGDVDAWLRSAAPDLVLVNVSFHTDDVSVAMACQRLGIPYVAVVHCAADGVWIESSAVAGTRAAYRAARRCFLLSEDNRSILETQLGTQLPHVTSFDNPLAVQPDTPLPWPDDGVTRLACVARLHFRSKGQDLVVDALRAARWRDRRARVDCYGADQGSRPALAGAVGAFGLGDRLGIAGYEPEPARIWERSHALLLPSRYEGLPIVTVEAMWAGRVPIVTACGRNAELVDDGETGFVAPAATHDAVSATLERAWERRDDWESIGTAAAARIRERYAQDPVGDFLGALEAVA